MAAAPNCLCLLCACVCLCSENFDVETVETVETVLPGRVSLSLCPYVWLSFKGSAHLSVDLAACLVAVHLAPTNLSVCLSVCL